MTYIPIRCQDCDCVLFSYEAKAKKLCPECEGCYEDEQQDLEDELENLLK